MKKNFLMLLGLFIALTATAQEKTVLTGNGKMVKEKREITGTFSKLVVSGPFEVRLVSGNGRLVIHSEENLLPLLTTTVSNGTLSIGSSQPLKPGTNQKIAIEVPFEQLQQLNLEGPGSVHVAKTIKNDIIVFLDGSGTINLTAKSSLVKACVLGSGIIKLNGRTSTLDCRVIGSGTIDGVALEASSVSAIVSGSGTVNTISHHYIKGRISGSGSIAFAGHPEQQDLKRAGTGEFTML